VPGHELRDETGRLHAIWIPPATVEIKCDSRFCGAVPGEVVVLHRFNVVTRVTTTLRFKAIDSRRKVNNATHNDPAAVRTS
jgi:hypothetical protein